MGGGSPLKPETKKQADALDAELARRGHTAKSFIAMRYWKPYAADAVREVKAWGADRVILLPLYPQFSSTTTASSLKSWKEPAARRRVRLPPKLFGAQAVRHGNPAAPNVRVLPASLPKQIGRSPSVVERSHPPLLPAD
jgi:ferrochelatase